MVSLRLDIFVRVVILLSISSSVWAQAKIDPKVTKRFKVDWSSTRYGKSLNIRKDSPKNEETSEQLSLSCELEILKPERLIGTSRVCTITQLLDPNGQNIALPPSGTARRGSIQARYEGLRYHRRFKPPSQPSRWLSLVRSVLRLPQRAPVRPEMVNELQPSGLQIDLDAGLCKQAGGEIGQIEGYFHALLAESLEHKDVPFEPNSNWIRLTDDVEIQIREAQCTGSSYHLVTESWPQGGASTHPLSVGDFLPARIVVGRQLLGADDKVIQDFGGYHGLPAHLNGSASGSGGDFGRIKKIRFIIAVNPTHYKIPFELEHIPLPKP